jgi:signal transduction histidine kinase
VASQAVANWLGANPLEFRFSPGPPSSPLAATSLVGDTGWILDAEISGAIAPAVAEGWAIRHQFRRTFAVTAAAVFLAAAAVVWILLQTDRLARQRAQFAAAAAHELKTPLAGLMLHSEMLAENLGDAASRERYAATVSSEAGRLGRVVSNMLDLSRLERGADLAHPRPGDLADFVRRFLDRTRPRLEDRGVTLEEAIQSGLPPVVFDDDALSQILDNLFDNAEKHTRSTPDRKVCVSAELHADKVRITIADNGPGIPRHQRRGLFKPFDRPDGSDGTPGLGLGLALARSLARAQGGELELVPADGPGTTFNLTLPVDIS